MDNPRTKAQGITRQKILKNKKLKRIEVSRFNNYNAVSNLSESSLMENGSPPKLKSRGI